MSDYGSEYRHVNGTVGQEPKVFQTAKGEITKFALVEQDGFGENAPTRWYDIAVFNEGLQAFVKSEIYKGAKVAVSGKFSVDNYNPEHPKPQILADHIGIVQYGTRTRKGEKPQELVSVGASAKIDF